MDCEKFDSITMELLYGELDELSEAAAHRHLHQCPRCRELWGHLRTTREIAEIPLEEPPSDLFDSILTAEMTAKKTLPAGERMSRAISVLAGYAMRPQLAMAALLLLMIGSSLVFVRNDPSGHGQVSVTELGTPNKEPGVRQVDQAEALVFEGASKSAAAPAGAASGRTATMKSALSDKQEESKTKADGGYREAMAAYQEGSYAEAERLFSEVASSGSERSASAALHEGHAARNGSGCQRAAALYDSVAERYAGGTVADEASWHAATCYRAMGQAKRASAHYLKLKNRAAYASRASKALEELAALEAVADASASDANSTSPTAVASKKAASPMKDDAAAAPISAKAKPKTPPASAAPAPTAPSPPPQAAPEKK